jgi:site-specific DNA recombinase
MIQKAKSGDMVEKKTKNVGIWIRVSTEDQAQGESPENHRKRAEMYIESKGWTVVRVYDLSGVSGKTVIEHPEARAMLADVASGKITGLVFSKLARLARSTKELLDFAEYFEKHGADLVSLAESLDTSTPAGRFFYTLISALAQWEREEISSRVKASVVIRAKMGKTLGGAAPFGYRWEGKKLVPDSLEAPVRKRLFELFLEVKRLKTVAAELNKAGHRTRSGSKFSDSTVRRLIENPTAKGLRRSNYTRSTGDGKHWDLKSPDEWIFTPVEPIVSEDLWAACNAILSTRKNGAKPQKRAVHLFTSLAFCQCGGTMTVLYQSPNYSCRKCKRRIAVADLEKVFKHELQKFFLSPEDVRQYLEAGNSTLSEKRDLVEAMRAEKARLHVEMDKTYKLYLEERITSEGFGERYRPLEVRQQELSEELPRLQGEADFLAIQHLSSEEIVSEAQDLYGRWDTLLQDEKRGIVENVLERITIGEDSVYIDLFSSPASPQTVVVGQRNLRDSSHRRE